MDYVVEERSKFYIQGRLAYKYAGIGSSDREIPIIQSRERKTYKKVPRHQSAHNEIFYKYPGNKKREHSNKSGLEVRTKQLILCHQTFKQNIALGTDITSIFPT